MAERPPDYEVFAIRYATRAARRAQHFVGGAISIDVRGHERADSAIVGMADGGDEAIVGEGFAEMHEAASRPGSVSSASKIHRGG